MMKMLTRGLVIAAATVAFAGAANAKVDESLFKKDIIKDIEAFRIGKRPVPCVPEPQTYAMLLLGLASVGWMARRRLTD